MDEDKSPESSDEDKDQCFEDFYGETVCLNRRHDSHSGEEVTSS